LHLQLVCSNFVTMKMVINNPDDLDLKGVYLIRNTENSKLYIGSASIKFRKRYNEHLNELRKGSHKNEYLQKSWNKYGEQSFVFEILEICKKEECLTKEQYWIDKHLTESKKIYNINKFATGTTGLPQSVIDKRGEKIRDYHKESTKYLKLLNEDKISESEVPEKYKKMIKSYSKRKPWNKGKNYESTDHLKVPKKKDRNDQPRIQAIRDKLPEIEVYSSNMQLLGKWKNTIELNTDSLKEDFVLKSHMRLMNKNGRNGYSPYLLQSCNVNRSATHGISYKGLYFKHKPLHRETGVE
jgi:group I intron endonuclease